MTAGGDPHSIQSRCTSSQTDANAISIFTDYANIIGPLLGNNCSFIGVDVALQGSNVRNPLSGWTTINGGSAAVGGVDLPRSVCFAGRSSDGRKVRVFQFGITSSLSTPAIYKQEPLTQVQFVDLRTLLNDSLNFFLGIGGLKPVYHDRTTFKPNDHWVGVVRS